jgi:hypothetical protein
LGRAYIPAPGDYIKTREDRVSYLNEGIIGKKCRY